MIEVVVVGGANIDMVIDLPHLPAEGETVTGYDFHRFYGGKGANQAVAAQKNGGNSAFISCIGRDSIDEKMLQYWQTLGINTEGVRQSDSHESGVAMIYVDKQSGKNCIALAAGANATLVPADIDRCQSWFNQATVVLLSLEVPLPTIAHSAELAAQAGCSVILDPAPSRKLPESLYHNLTIMTPNENEAYLMTNIAINDQQSAQHACQILHERGTKTVLLTMGEKGVLLSSHNQPAQWLPAFHVAANDTTAAGDTFNGALAAALAKQHRLHDAIQFAQAAAALAITNLGAQISIPKLQDVQEFLQHRYPTL